MQSNRSAAAIPNNCRISNNRDRNRRRGIRRVIFREPDKSSSSAIAQCPESIYFNATRPLSKTLTPLLQLSRCHSRLRESVRSIWRKVYLLF
ncbi:hypothetical protein PUN28_000202 [Cardiocondyla obscurior]|uniref:Uncharacterized protein n=1 Tax=Cardiocondyla obscurior TaxID=286306 RepID=A0AAW2GY80_9HYME